MQQPLKFETQGEYICRLKKAIYDLKQSPRTWFQRLSEIFVTIGLQRSSANHSLFVRKTKNGVVALFVYVDDLIITEDDSTGISEVKQFLAQQFMMKDLEQLRYFLDIEVATSKDGITLSQRKYALDILREASMLGSKEAIIPMNLKTHLYEQTIEVIDSTTYRQLVGKLLYLTITRPDTALAVNKLSLWINPPKPTGKQLYKYLDI